MGRPGLLFGTNFAVKRAGSVQKDLGPDRPKRFENPFCYVKMKGHSVSPRSDGSTLWLNRVPQYAKAKGAPGPFEPKWPRKGTP